MAQNVEAETFMVVQGYMVDTLGISPNRMKVLELEKPLEYLARLQSLLRALSFRLL